MISFCWMVSVPAIVRTEVGGQSRWVGALCHWSVIAVGRRLEFLRFGSMSYAARMHWQNPQIRGQRLTTSSPPSPCLSLPSPTNSSTSAPSTSSLTILSVLLTLSYPLPSSAVLSTSSSHPTPSEQEYVASCST